MKKLLILIAALLISPSVAVYANHHEAGGHHNHALDQSLFKSTFLGKLSSSNGKIMALAAEFPEEAYDWRPAEGIRSVRESILHVAQTNYFLATKLGATPPAGTQTKNLDSVVSGKGNVLRVIEDSIRFVTATIEGLSEGELASRVKFFGNKVPKLFVVLQVSDHATEHLGQLIAYARSTGVTPPWSKQS